MHDSQNIKLILNSFNLLKPMVTCINKFNIEELYILPTPYLCVLYSYHNNQRLLPHIPYTDWFYNWDEKCLLRGTNWIFK